MPTSHVSIENYLDDLAGADTPNKALKSFYELGKTLERKHWKKSCPPSTQMIFIGVCFDTESLTLLVTHERLQEITNLVNS